MQIFWGDFNKKNEKSTRALAYIKKKSTSLEGLLLWFIKTLSYILTNFK